MSICKGCGKPIKWIKTKAGKAMPVDPDPVWVYEEGKEKFATDAGEVITGSAKAPEAKETGEIHTCLGLAYVPHWSTCPAAGSFRKK